MKPKKFKSKNFLVFLAVAIGILVTPVIASATLPAGSNFIGTYFMNDVSGTTSHMVATTGNLRLWAFFVGPNGNYNTIYATSPNSFKIGVGNNGFSATYSQHYPHNPVTNDIDFNILLGTLQTQGHVALSGLFQNVVTISFASHNNTYVKR